MPLPLRRYYANAAPQLTLASSITASSTTLTASSFAGWPSTPFYAAIDDGQVTVEIVLVTNITGSTATIVRGQDNTPASSHAAGATLDHVVIRLDFDEANAHTSSTSGHGTTSPVVGEDDVQTLTNKTLTSPVVNTPTITGGSIGGAALTATGAALTSPTLSGTTILGGDVDNSGSHKFTGNPALIGQAAASGGRPLSLRDHTGAEKVSVDELGNVAALSVSGILKPTVYASATARDAAITAPADGMVVFLTDVNKLYVYSSSDSAWLVVGSGGSSAPTWTTPTITNGSTPTGYQPVRYGLDGAGFVHIEGVLQPTANIFGAVTLFTLPTGMRPSATQVCAVIQMGTTPAVLALEIKNTGIVTCDQTMTTGNNYALSAIFYPG